MILQRYNYGCKYGTTNTLHTNMITSRKNKRRHECYSTIQLNKSKNQSNTFRRQFPKVFSNRTNSHEDYSSPNVINIVNNVRKQSISAEKKIDLKMNINRYNIKCYLGTSRRISNLFNECNDSKLRTTNTPDSIFSRKKKDMNNHLPEMNQSLEPEGKPITDFRKSISVKKRRAVKLLITTDDDDEEDEFDSDYGTVQKQSNNKIGKTRIKAKLLKLMTMNDNTARKNNNLDQVFENYFDDENNPLSESFRNMFRDKQPINHNTEDNNIQNRGETENDPEDNMITSNTIDINRKNRNKKKNSMLNLQNMSESKTETKRPINLKVMKTHELLKNNTIIGEELENNKIEVMPKLDLTKPKNQEHKSDDIKKDTLMLNHNEIYNITTLPKEKKVKYNKQEDNQEDNLITLKQMEPIKKNKYKKKKSILNSLAQNMTESKTEMKRPINLKVMKTKELFKNNTTTGEELANSKMDMIPKLNLSKPENEQNISGYNGTDILMLNHNEKANINTLPKDKRDFLEVEQEDNLIPSKPMDPIKKDKNKKKNSILNTLAQNMTERKTETKRLINLKVMKTKASIGGQLENSKMDMIPKLNLSKPNYQENDSDNNGKDILIPNNKEVRNIQTPKGKISYNNYLIDKQDLSLQKDNNQTFVDQQKSMNDNPKNDEFTNRKAHTNVIEDISVNQDLQEKDLKEKNKKNVNTILQNEKSRMSNLLVLNNRKESDSIGNFKDKDFIESTFCISRNRESKKSIILNKVGVEVYDNDKSISTLTNNQGNHLTFNETNTLKINKKKSSIKKCLLDSNKEVLSSEHPSNVQLLTISTQKEIDNSFHDDKNTINTTEFNQNSKSTGKTMTRKISKRRQTIFISNKETDSKEKNFKSDIKHRESKSYKRTYSKEIFNDMFFISPKKKKPQSFSRKHTINDISFSSLDSHGSNSSFSQIESEKLVHKIFKTIRNEDEDYKRLNGCYSYDNIDFKEKEYNRYLELCKGEIKKINKTCGVLESIVENSKESLINRSLCNMSNKVMTHKQLNVKKDYIIELQSKLENFQDYHVIEIMLLLYYQSLSLENIPLVNGKMKEKILSKYFDLHDEITDDLLVQRRPSKRVTITKKNLKKPQFNLLTLKFISKMALDRVDNLLFINQFINRDIQEVLTQSIEQEKTDEQFDEIIKIYNRSKTTKSYGKKDKNSRRRSKSKFNNLNTHREDLACLKDLRNPNERKSITPKKSLQASKFSQLANNTLQVADASLAKFSMTKILISNINQNRIKIKNRIRIKKKKMENIDRLFSSENKEITMIQTSEIKNRYIESISNDLHEKIIFYIKDSNYFQMNEIISNNFLAVDMNYQDNKGNTFLIYCTQINSFQICKYLLDKGCNPNICNLHNSSPLHYALSIRNFQIANLLLNFGANESIINNEGYTPWESLGRSMD